MEWAPHVSLASLPADVFGEFPQEPEVTDWTAIFWDAFHHLCRFREFGAMGQPLPISEEAIIRYAQRRGPDDPDDLDDLIAVVSDLDRAWMDHKPGKPTP